MSEITKKIVAVVLTLALAFTAVPGVVAGQTVAQLQAQINELQAIIAQLQGRVTTPAAGAPAVCEGVTFARNLSFGATGSDVRCLQALLNTDAATRVAATGIGSAGQETERFGSLTRTAVIAFQNKYASEVLAPVGLTVGTGFVGALTRVKLNAMLTAAPDREEEEEEEEKQEEKAVEAVEGTLISRLLPTPVAVDVDHNASNVSVMGFEVEARDSAITIERVDVNFANTARPWRRINHIAIFDGADLVQRVAVTSANVTELTSTASRIRFSGLNINVPRNTRKALTLRVSTDARPVETQSTTLTIPTDGIRGVDGRGINQTAPGIGAAAHTRPFTIKATAEGGRIEVRANTANPREGIAITNVDNITEHELLRADLVVTRDNVQVREITFAIPTPSITPVTNVRAFRLYDGTTLLGSVDGNNGATVTAAPRFSNLSLSINAGTTKTLSLRVEVERNTTGNVLANLVGRAGATINVVALSANDADVEVLERTVAGETINLLTVAPVISNISVTTNRVTATTVDATISFNLRAEGGDITLPVGVPGSPGDNIRTTILAATGADQSAVSATIGGRSFGAGEPTAGERTILNGQTRAIVVTGRVSRTAAAPDVVTWFGVDRIQWRVGASNDATGSPLISMPTALLRDLRTTNFILD